MTPADLTGEPGKFTLFLFYTSTGIASKLGVYERSDAAVDAARAELKTLRGHKSGRKQSGETGEWEEELVLVSPTGVPHPLRSLLASPVRRDKFMSKWVMDENGHTYPEPDLAKWSMWFEYERIPEGRIGHTQIAKECSVSTVFLGLDHGFAPDGPPVLFETMIFGGQLAQYCTRYSTWEEAVQGHRDTVLRALRVERQVVEPTAERIEHCTIYGHGELLAADTGDALCTQCGVAQYAAEPALVTYGRDDGRDDGRETLGPA